MPMQREREKKDKEEGQKQRNEGEKELDPIKENAIRQIIVISMDKHKDKTTNK
jgi:hypothetical protein